MCENTQTFFLIFVVYNCIFIYLMQERDAVCSPYCTKMSIEESPSEEMWKKWHTGTYILLQPCTTHNIDSYIC